MKTRWIVLLTVAVIALGSTYWHGALVAPAFAGDQIISAAARVTLPALGDDGDKYVGSSKCKKCHMKHNKSWKVTRMAKAFEILKPGQSSEIKTKFNLDPAKDYTADENCIGCHTTGYGHDGGYAVPDPDDKKSVKKAKKRQGVGCESCHGPGGRYVKVHEEIMKSKRTYKVEEMYEAGMWKAGAESCANCHNEKSPTFNPDEPFDYEAKKDVGRHDKIELKQRG